MSVLESENQVHLKTQNFQIAEMDKKNKQKITIIECFLCLLQSAFKGCLISWKLKPSTARGFISVGQIPVTVFTAASQSVSYWDLTRNSPK